jgi:hypothetical protein
LNQLHCRCGYTSKEDWRFFRHQDRMKDDPEHIAKIRQSYLDEHLEPPTWTEPKRLGA